MLFFKSDYLGWLGGHIKPDAAAPAGSGGPRRSTKKERVISNKQKRRLKKKTIFVNRRQTRLSIEMSQGQT
jgi:hypothetical protein